MRESKKEGEHTHMVVHFPKNHVVLTTYKQEVATHGYLVKSKRKIYLCFGHVILQFDRVFKSI